MSDTVNFIIGVFTGMVCTVLLITVVLHNARTLSKKTMEAWQAFIDACREAWNK